MEISEKILKLQDLMRKNQIDTYIITKLDPHNSEYTQDYHNSVKFISGFNGSKALVVITQNEAHLWTDGRYFIQAERELSGTGINLQKEGEPGVKDYMSFIRDNTKSGGRVGFDGKTLTAFEVLSLKKIIKNKNIDIKFEIDLVSEIWNNRPKLIENNIFIHDIKFSGKSRKEKILEVKEIMQKENIDTYLISSLDDIAWLFNLRVIGQSNNTTFISYALIEKDSVKLFVNLEIVKDVYEVLVAENVTVVDYNSIFDNLNEIKEKNVLALCLNNTNYYLYQKLIKFEIKSIDYDLTTNLKSCKNQVEIKNLKEACLIDSVALLKFVKWLKENVDKNSISEFDIDGKLVEYRRQNENYLCPSFDTIAGYMENGAIVHYRASRENCKILTDYGFLLLDSGGQYLNGTTDITRTIVLGEITEKMKADFTLTLKSSIAIAKAIFLEGTGGMQLDILARKPFWDNYLNYKHGTGHGIGYVLNVHEGPQSISQKSLNVPFKIGMITSNEPGLYRQNEYGIRLENTILVINSKENDFGNFFEFETISYFPIDVNAINVEMLNNEELEWINNYHKDVFQKLSPYLNKEEIEFLKNETRSI